MDQHVGPRREQVNQNQIGQALWSLYRNTLRLSGRRGLPPEDAKDAAMQAIEDYLVDLTAFLSTCSTQREQDAVTLLSDKEVRKRAAATACDAARKHRRERDCRAAPGSDHTEGDPAHGGPADVADPAKPLQAQVLEHEFLETVGAILAALPQETGAQFWRHHVDQISFIDLGQQHECNPETIRKRLRRALPRLREELARQGWDETGSA